MNTERIAQLLRELANAFDGDDYSPVTRKAQPDAAAHQQPPTSFSSAPQLRRQVGDGLPALSSIREHVGPAAPEPRRRSPLDDWDITAYSPNITPELRAVLSSAEIGRIEAIRFQGTGPEGVVVYGKTRTEVEQQIFAMETP